MSVVKSKPPINSASTRIAKVVILGDSGVGKSSLIARFVTNTFKPNNEPTIGAAFLAKTITVKSGLQVNYQIWDTAGQERYHNIAPGMYYRGAQAAILVYSIVDERSFERLRFWQSELLTHCAGDLSLAVVGSKLDLNSSRVVCTASAEEYASSVGALYLETSSKENINVGDLFEQLYDRLPADDTKDKQVIKLSAFKEGRDGNRTTKSCC